MTSLAGAAQLNYQQLSREQAISLLVKRDAQRKLGLVWEREEIERDLALNGDFVVMDLGGDDRPSRGEAPYRNLLIEGDNFDALRWLSMTHAGRVRCIYIDPPYNTGNRDWVYNDKFVKKDDRFRHSTWLEFMFRRLEIAKNLLAPDGALFVSIDDNEGPYLKLLLDEVFGRDMFVTSFIWRKVDSPNDNKVKIAPDHEYIHCYASDEALARFRRMSADSILDAFRQRDERGRLCRDRLLRKNGKNSLRKDRPTMHFPLAAPDGTEVLPMLDNGLEGRWSHSKDGIARLQAEGRLIWKQVPGQDGRLAWVPYAREYAPETPDRPFPSIWADVMTTRQSKAHHKEMFPGVEPFVTPKPEQLMARILGMATEPGDLVLDFFLGSGTTAAVATKMGRRWIGVETEAEIAGFASARLAKVIEGEPGGISEDLGWDGGGGFAHLVADRVAFEDFAYDLKPRHLWLAIQAMHGVPLAPYDPDAALQVGLAEDGAAVAYCDRFTPAAEERVADLLARHQFLIVYAYTPGPLRDALEGRNSVEIRAVPDELVRRFQA
ncbi:site-specific DNA-methyltransferase (plasmid) [Azospirillum ramasamyi]|uniref:site-specific DNA-methyltransferase (adenine-specific) n=1 Tax=Azospirillum ramasamyi TaxID=682998 RepID=A0A2U9S9G0_9PROT|nr:site-specific DNA-methyltransferase [Azospirillum ramasamyi]